MANTTQELADNLSIFNDRSTVDQILATEVRDHSGMIINSMVNLSTNRDTLSLFTYQEMRSVPYKTNEIVFNNDKFYKALEDNIQGVFDIDKWQVLDIMSMNDTSFTRTIVGHDFVVGEMVYHDGTGYKKSIANEDAFDNDSYALFVVKKAVSDEVTFGTTGAIVEMSFSYPDATPLYLSNVVDGAVSDERPFNSPYQQVGYYADGILHFNPIPIAIKETEEIEEDPIPTSTIINKTADFSTDSNSINTYYRFDSLTNGICTIESGTLPVGETVFIRQVGDGVLTFVAGAGVTLIPNLSEELLSVGKGDTVSFIAVDADVYEMI